MKIEMKKEEPEFEILREVKHRECLEEEASWLNRLFFKWTSTIIQLGKTKILRENDLFDILKEEKFQWGFTRFVSYNQERDRHQRPRNYLRALFYSSRGVVISIVLLSLFANLLQFSGPLILGKILTFLTNKTEKERQKPGYVEIPNEWGWIWATVLLFSFILRIFLQQHSMHKTNRLSCIITNCLMGSVYEKVFKLSSAGRKYQDPGKIMNLINVDTQTIATCCQMVSMMMLTIPIMVLGSITLICIQIGYVGLIGPVLLVLAIFLQNYIQDKASSYRKSQMQYTDKRSKSLMEFFSGIKVIKYYAWERIVQRKISDIRKKELDFVLKGSLMMGLIEVIANTIPIFMMIAIFGLYTYLGNDFNIAKAFTVLALFNLMITPLRMIANILMFVTNSKVALKRLQHFSLAEERLGDEVDLDSRLGRGSIKIYGGCFSWESNFSKEHAEQGKNLMKPVDKKKLPKSDDKVIKKDSKKDLTKPLLDSRNELNTEITTLNTKNENEEYKILDEINFTCKSRELIAIVGQVGSGKSSFLNSILGEMFKISGTVKLNGSVAYVPQVAWLMNASIRDNILFGREFNEEKYKNILNICELEEDLEIFPGGDLTEIGEKGVNLSGGQKQRVSLARALYDDADIYLVDDSLSAMDAHVGRKIFENVFKVYLNLKTILFVTHSLHYVPQCDRIVVFKNGKIWEEGSYFVLTENKESEFNRINVLFQNSSKVKAENSKQLPVHSANMVAVKTEKPSSTKQDNPKTDLEKKKLGALVKIEEKAEGTVPLKIYKNYFLLGGVMNAFGVLLFFISTQALRTLTDWWLGIWSERRFELSLGDYIMIYAILSIITGFLYFIRNYVYSKWVLKKAKTYQENLLDTLLRSPLGWFDVTPSGRILSRTTKDQDTVDSNLPTNISASTNQLIMAMSSIVIAGVASPFYFVLAFIITIVYFYMIRDYIQGAREVKRIELGMRSPLITHLNETINGVTIIKAYGRVNAFRKRFEERVDDVNRASQNFLFCGRWIAFRSDIFATILIASTAYFGILTVYLDNMDPTLVGLAITSALTTSSILALFIRSLATTESLMSSVQRIVDYIEKNPSEKEFDTPKPPIEPWPTEGAYKAENVTYRYRENLGNVLHGISFSFNRFEKIGVVGRTGSGKSTLTLGLLRILELVESENGEIGKIELDNVDIAKVGLHYLRGRIAIVPQDPTLFTETLRFNIDPFNEFNDSEIAQALKKVQIWDALKIKEQFLAGTSEEIKAKLRIEVTGGGSNFSVGQRQLICMARALIRKPKILLMDEATASIDEMTDQLIQKMIKEEFTNSCVITIAHRLNTIISYDKVMVLDRGTIAEFDTPWNLLQKQESQLLGLVREQGKEFENEMLKIASLGKLS